MGTYTAKMQTIARKTRGQHARLFRGTSARVFVGGRCAPSLTRMVCVRCYCKGLLHTRANICPYNLTYILSKAGVDEGHAQSRHHCGCGCRGCWQNRRERCAAEHAGADVRGTHRSLRLQPLDHDDPISGARFWPFLYNPSRFCLFGLRARLELHRRVPLRDLRALTPAAIAETPVNLLAPPSAISS